MADPTTPDPNQIDPADPVFISYRHSDGMDTTTDLAWLLRAAGIPVWRDLDDLPPGDTDERLAQAIDDGLSGGVLVLTPDIAKSAVVKTIEAPKLLELHQNHSEFALGILNAVEREPGKTDYTAPDRLLELPGKALVSTYQRPADADGIYDLVKGLVWHRIAAHRDLVAADDSTFNLSIQTRNAAQVYDRTGAQLDIRTRPSTHERLPSPEGLRDVARVIGLVPDAVTRSGASRIRITGGAHLSVAFALGAALPATRIGHLEVLDQESETWVGSGTPTVADPPLLRVVRSSADPLPGGSEEGAPPGPSGRPTVAVYLDLLDFASDAAFERFLEEHGGHFAAWRHLARVASGRLDPRQAGATAAEAAALMRTLSAEHSNAAVHLMLRCPFPMAVLVGRLANTLRVTAYEWDPSDPDSNSRTEGRSGGDFGEDFRPRFVPSIEVHAGVPTGVITSVLLAGPTST